MIRGWLDGLAASMTSEALAEAVRRGEAADLAGLLALGAGEGTA